MITTDQTGAGFPVRWTTHPRINAKPWLLIAAAVLLPTLLALSLPRSEPKHAIADDPKYVLPVLFTPSPSKPSRISDAS
jgi:hypothetical protein